MEDQISCHDHPNIVNPNCPACKLVSLANARLTPFIGPDKIVVVSNPSEHCWVKERFIESVKARMSESDFKTLYQGEWNVEDYDDREREERSEEAERLHMQNKPRSEQIDDLRFI